MLLESAPEAATLTLPLRLAVWAVSGLTVLLQPASAPGAPALRSASVRITFSSATACEVTVDFDVTGAPSVEHRLELLEGASVDLLEVTGGSAGEPPRDIGRTRALRVTPDTAGGAYALRYRVNQTPARPYRCPLWLPAAPANGRDRAVVRIAVTLPEGMTADGSMPSFSWRGREGEAVLAHLPAFVVVPFRASSAGRSWDVSRVMDLAALGTLAAASLVWAVRRKGRA